MFYVEFDGSGFYLGRSRSMVGPRTEPGESHTGQSNWPRTLGHKCGGVRKVHYWPHFKTLFLILRFQLHFSYFKQIHTCSFGKTCFRTVQTCWKSAETYLRQKRSFSTDLDDCKKWQTDCCVFRLRRLEHSSKLRSRLSFKINVVLLECFISN